jgi:hypothetical protein
MGRNRYRVFVSYSHEDEELMKTIVNRLKAINVEPLFDQSLKPGDRFSDVIKRYIAHSHVFMPIITSKSAGRPWVHQEMGYAMGLSIPLFPIAVGSLPDGLSSELHALQLKTDLSGIEDKLTEDAVENRAISKVTAGDSVYQAAENLNDRTRMLVDYAGEIIELGFYGMVRQRSAFGSFSLPDNRPQARIWERREDGSMRNQQERDLLRDERRCMEQHARQEGCRLILDPESVASFGKSAIDIRLKLLKEFIESMSADQMEVVFARKEIRSGLIIVGDWFLADAVVPYYGNDYQKTLFTRHGPTVIRAIEMFDREFEELKREAGTASAKAAIEHINALISS